MESVTMKPTYSDLRNRTRQILDSVDDDLLASARGGVRLLDPNDAVFPFKSIARLSSTCRAAGGSARLSSNAKPEAALFGYAGN